MWHLGSGIGLKELRLHNPFWDCRASWNMQPCIPDPESTPDLHTSFRMRPCSCCSHFSNCKNLLHRTRSGNVSSSHNRFLRIILGTWKNQCDMYLMLSNILWSSSLSCNLSWSYMLRSRTKNLLQLNRRGNCHSNQCKNHLGTPGKDNLSHICKVYFVEMIKTWFVNLP
jgi:hypothetical protein